MNRIWFVGMVLISLVSSPGPGDPVVVALAVRYNGREQPPPTSVMLTIDGRSVRLPVRQGKFEVSSDVLNARDVMFAADIGPDHVRIPGLPGSKFSQDSWTLLLADREYNVNYEWSVPKGVDVRRSCMLVFESARSGAAVQIAATQVFVRDCRSARK